MATFNVSSKYKNIKSKSRLISSGSPDVYRLRPKEKKFGTLTRKSVGEKNLNKTNKTILLVGETGAGKSALINALLNYTMGVKFDENIWFEIVEDEKRRKLKSKTSDKEGQCESLTSDEEEDQCESLTSDEEEDQCESLTSDVIVYKIFGFEDKTLPFSLTIIDTPGFGDTRGIERDELVSQRLLDLFCSKDGVHELDAVGLVLKASENRVSDRQKYIFDSVTSLFGKDIEKNIVALITHSDGTLPDNALQALKAANIRCAQYKSTETVQPVYFLFSNCRTNRGSERSLKYAWETTKEGMDQFTAFLGKTAPQKLKATVDVLNERETLKACINNLQDRIKHIEQKQTKIQQIQEALKNHETMMEMNKNFTIEFELEYKAKEPIDGGRNWLFFYKGAVCCTTCEETCHHPCKVALNPKDCGVIKEHKEDTHVTTRHCTVCTGKCPASDHVKVQWIYVNKTKTVQQTFDDMKHDYEKNKSECDKKKSLLENLQTEMEELKAAKIKWLAEAYLHVLTLEQIALNANSLSTHVHLDFLIEKMKETGDTEKVKKLGEMKSRVGEGTRAGLRYKKTKSAKK